MPDGLPDVPETMMESIGDAVEGVATPAPVESTNQPVEETTATPEGTTEEAATEAPDSFTKLDPNSLPEELRPYYTSMQADYTRKQQEASPWRKLGEELGISSPDEVRQAAELFAYLQDPNNVKTFYEQLTPHFGTQAAAPAATPAVPAETADEFTALDDPGLAEVRAQIDALKAEVTAVNQAREAEATQWHLLGEMNRQEALLKQEHPDWKEDGEEWSAIWNMAPAFGGDLTTPAQLIATAQNAAVVRLLNGKAAAAETEGLSAPPIARTGVTPPETPDYSNDPELKGPTAQAREFLRGLVNQSE